MAKKAVKKVAKKAVKKVAKKAVKKVAKKAVKKVAKKAVKKVAKKAVSKVPKNEEKKVNSFKSKGVALEQLPDGLWRITNVKTNLGEEVISNQEALMKAIYEEGQERGWYGWKEFGLFSAFCTQQMVSKDIDYFGPKLKELIEIQTDWIKSGEILEKKLFYNVLTNANIAAQPIDDKFWKEWTDYLNSLPFHQRATIGLLNGMFSVNFFYGAMIATGILKASEYYRLEYPAPDQPNDWNAYKAVPWKLDIIQKYLVLAGS